MNARLDPDLLAERMAERVRSDSAWMQEAAQDAADRLLGFEAFGPLILDAHGASWSIRAIAEGLRPPPIWPALTPAEEAASAAAFVALCRRLLPLSLALEAAIESETFRRLEVNA